MLITNLQGESSLLNDLARPSNTGTLDDSVGGSFYRLVSSLTSGDDTAYAQRFPGTPRESTGQDNAVVSPIRQVLSQVRTALSAGDIGAAEEALSSLESGMSAAAGSAYAALPQRAISSSGSVVSELGGKVLNFMQAVRSGDLQSAQSVYGSLSDLLPATDAPSTYNISPAAQNASPSDFSSLRSRVEMALESGNVGSAEAAMQALLQEFSAGSILRTVA